MRHLLFAIAALFMCSQQAESQPYNDVRIPGDYATVTEALAEFSVGDRLVFAAGTHAVDNQALPDGLVMKSADGLSPDQVILQAAPGQRALRVQNANLLGVSLERLTISCPTTVGVNGAGLFTENSIVNLNDIVLDNCQSSASGGGAYFEQTELHMETVVFKNCSAHHGGGAYFSMCADVTMDLLSFTDNAAVTGGGLQIAGCSIDFASLAVSGNSVVATESESAQGGGITAVPQFETKMPESLAFVVHCKC